MRGRWDLFLVFMVVSCTANPNRAFHPAPVESALSRAMSEPPGALVVLDSLGPQSWTLMYLFGPYTSQDAMRRCLATSEFEHYNLDRRDDIYALYFKSSSGGVQIWSLTLPRARVVFATDAVGREYARGSGQFSVRRAASGDGKELAPSGSSRTCS